MNYKKCLPVRVCAYVRACEDECAALLQARRKKNGTHYLADDFHTKDNLNCCIIQDSCLKGR